MENRMGPQLLGLAPELVAHIVKQIDSKGDLRNIRLVCKTLDKHASKELFREVYLSRDERHMDSWNSIGQSEILRQIPRHVVIEPRPDSGYEDDLWSIHGGNSDNEEEKEEEKGEGEELDEVWNPNDFSKAIKAISRFPNVDSVEIVFTEDCVGEDHSFWDDVVESSSFRERALQIIFSAVSERPEDSRKVRKLTIVNLQNCEYLNLTTSDEFDTVMGGLEELHLGLIQEHNEHGPDHDYLKKELQTFPFYLCYSWLEPVSSHLKALSIYSLRENWGPFPGYFDPSGISFPKLEALALGYYTLAHDDDINWILSIKSLRKLTLHNCMILSKIRIDGENLEEWNVKTHDWKPMVNSGGYGKCYSYDTRWNTFIDRIHDSLPNLADFRFDYTSNYSVNSRDACGNRMFPRRYVTFDNGVLPTHWPEADRSGAMYEFETSGERREQDWPNLHKENMALDQESMNRILRRKK